MSDTGDCDGAGIKSIDHEPTEFDLAYQLWLDVHECIRERPLSSALMAYDTFEQFYDFYRYISSKSSSLD